MPKFKWGPASFAVSLLALMLSLGGTSFALTQSPAAPATAGLPAWHNLTLKNGWVNGGSGSYAAGWYIDSGQVVHLRGSLAGGSVSAMAFRLPNAERPAHTLWLSIYTFDGSSGGLEIEPNGAAFVFDDAGDTNPVDYSSLDGVSFRVP